MALEFQFNLGGNFIGALEKSRKGLSEHSAETKHAEKALELFEGELGKVQAGALALNFSAFQEGGHFLKFDLAEGAALAFEAIHKVIESVIDLGAEIVKAAADAQDLNLAIKLDIGEEGAEKVDALAESFGDSRFSPKQIKEALLPILEESGNTHQDQWNDLTTAATDVATRRNTGVAGAKAALESLNDIELNPQRLRGSLKQLGIKQAEYYADLGNLLGISSKTAEEQTKAGKIKSQTLLSVALNQIAEREGGALGNATNEGATTLGATLARMSALKDTLFERIAEGKGVKAIQGVLDGFVQLMKGPLGDRLMTGVDSALESVAGWMAQITSPAGIDKLTSGFSSVVDAAKMIPGILGEMVRLTEEVAVIWGGTKILGGVTSFISLLSSSTLAGALSGLRAGLNAALSPVMAITAAFEAWRYAISEISATVKELGGFKQVGQDVKDFFGGQNHSGVANDAVNANSPAWKRGGAIAVADIVGLPKFASGGLVDRPTIALVGEAGPEMITPMRGGRSTGGASVTLNVGDIVVTAASGDPAETARLVRIELKKLVDEANAALGAAA